MSSVLNTTTLLPQGRFWNKYIDIHKDVESNTADGYYDLVSKPGSVRCLEQKHGYLFGFRNPTFDFILSLDGLPKTSSINDYDDESTQFTKSLKDNGFHDLTLLFWDPDKNIYSKMIDRNPIPLCDQPAKTGSIRLINTGSDIIEPNHVVGLFYPNEHDRQYQMKEFGPNCPTLLATRVIKPDMCNAYQLHKLKSLRKRVLTDAEKLPDADDFAFLCKLSIMLKHGLSLSDMVKLIVQKNDDLHRVGERRSGSSNSSNVTSKKRKRDEEDMYLAGGKYAELEFDYSKRKHETGATNETSVITLAGRDGLSADQERALHFMTSVKHNPLISSYSAFESKRNSIAHSYDASGRHMISRLSGLFDGVNPHDDDIAILSFMCKLLDDKRERADISLANARKLTTDPLETIQKRVMMNNAARAPEQTQQCIHRNIKMIVFKTMLQLCGLYEGDVGKICMIPDTDEDLILALNQLAAVSQSTYDLNRPFFSIGRCTVGEDSQILNKSRPGSTFQLDPLYDKLQCNYHTLPTIIY